MKRGMWADGEIVLGERPEEWGPSVPGRSLIKMSPTPAKCCYCGEVSTEWAFYPPEYFPWYHGEERTRIACDECYIRADEEYQERMEEYYSMVL